MIDDMSVADAAWAADLMERRRQEYARYSPVFWRPAVGVRDLHRQFLVSLIRNERVIALRSRHAFVICQRRRGEGVVDDFAVEPPGTWNDEGAALLRAVAGRLAGTGESAATGGISALRVVTADADRPKVSMLESLSLTLAEQWWVRELTPADGGSAGGPAGGTAGGSAGGPVSVTAGNERVEGPGFSGVLTSAPAVYNPGGPVFDADRVEPDADLTAVERGAARLGAVLAVAPAAPGSALAANLRRSGWTVASDWYLGWPGRARDSDPATGA